MLLGQSPLVVQFCPTLVPDAHTFCVPVVLTRVYGRHLPPPVQSASTLHAMPFKVPPTQVPGLPALVGADTPSERTALTPRHACCALSGSRRRNPEVIMLVTMVLATRPAVPRRSRAPNHVPVVGLPVCPFEPTTVMLQNCGVDSARLLKPRSLLSPSKPLSF